MGMRYYPTFADVPPADAQKPGAYPEKNNCRRQSLFPPTEEEAQVQGLASPFSSPTLTLTTFHDDLTSPKPHLIITYITSLTHTTYHVIPQHINSLTFYHIPLLTHILSPTHSHPPTHSHSLTHPFTHPPTSYHPPPPPHLSGCTWSVVCAASRTTRTPGGSSWLPCARSLSKHRRLTRHPLPRR